MREWVYGRNAVLETLRAKRRQVFTLEIAEGVQEKGPIAELLQLALARRIEITRTARTHLDRLNSNHQGVALETSGYPYAEVTGIFELAESRQEPLFVLLLDALNDPQNFGSLLRTAEAVGIHGVIIPLRQTVTVTPAVVNASAGASEHLLIAQANLHQVTQTLKENGAWVIGLEGSPEGHEISSGALNQMPLQGALGLVVGSEGKGMRPLVAQSCDILLKLPMVGRIGSLNASVAGSVALYLVFLQRRKQ